MSSDRTPTRMVDSRSQPATAVFDEFATLWPACLPTSPLKRSDAPESGLVRFAKSRLPMIDTSTPKPSFWMTFDDTTVDSTTTCDGGVSMSLRRVSTALMLSG